jgi:hypothetical protein
VVFVAKNEVVVVHGDGVVCAGDVTKICVGVHALVMWQIRGREGCMWFALVSGKDSCVVRRE